MEGVCAREEMPVNEVSCELTFPVRSLDYRQLG